jgi:RHS repeat-associated protein
VTFAQGNGSTDSGGTIAMPGSAFYTWNYQTGNGQPSSLAISLNNDTSGATNWSAAIVAGNWLYLNNSPNTTAGGSFNTNGIATFSINPANLSWMSTGTYTGTIVVQDSVGNQCTITVTLNVNVPSPIYPYAYHYSYNAAGRVTKQRLHVPNPEWDFDASYAWDNQGRMTSQTYPGGNNNFSYQYDAMGNLSAITNVASATYNFAGQMSTLSWGGDIQEWRSYDSQLRLTGIVTGGYQSPMLNETYVYSATADNGRITKTVNGISGETITYAYDEINRLASATSSGGTWSQQYSYDGFGNLTGTNGSAVWTFDPATNHIGSTGANGNPSGYDIENRMVNDGAYTYDPWGKRISQTQIGQDGPRTSTVYFYGIGGQKLQAFSCTTDSGSGNPNCGVQTTNIYFGGKLITTNGINVATDRLGSVRANTSGERISYYPYGQERPQSNGQTTADGRDKFATYFRDGVGQDYADQRYYNQAGRFFSPDPGGISTASASEPSSWNRYDYAGGDPVNNYDPEGLFYAVAPQPTPGPQTGYNPQPLDPSPYPFASGGKNMAMPELPGDDDEEVGGGPGLAPAINPPCHPDFLDPKKTYEGAGGYSFTGKDINFAARVIFAESTGDAQEDLAMADVIYNRVENEDWRHGRLKTLTAVVMQPHQFNAVTPPGPNRKFNLSGRGKYEGLNPTDCAGLKDAIRKMLSVVMNGSDATYTSFGAAGTHQGTIIGGSVFF